MRFQQLQIPAFGPFTSLDLEFHHQPADLQVIFGPNEAGKSSLLRAIRDLLFGIPGQSSDNFLHAYAQLRIKAEIRNRAGDSLLFQRRKGNKNDLLDGDGNPLPDDALARFLGGVDPACFSAMFGLGGRELHEGARQLLRGEGDMGQALFSASLGGTPVQNVLNALVEQSERLFKGRATASVTIRPAVTRYKDLLRQCREAMVNPETWDTLQRELGQAESARQTLEEEIDALDRELAWIARCEDALPSAGRLVEELLHLSQLPALPELASDFVPRTQSARGAVTAAHLDRQRLAGQLRKLESQLPACQPSPALLAQADALDRLHRHLGAYQQSRKNLADLTMRLAGIEPLLRAGMDNLQLTREVESLSACRLSSPARLACEEAAAALRTALAEQTAATRKAEELQEQIETGERQLQSLPEPSLNPLREALALAAEATDADRTFSSGELELARLARETAGLHHQVIGAPADLDATARLPAPAAAAIRQAQQQIDALTRQIQAEDGKVLEAQTRIDTIQADLARIQRQGPLPSEEALRHAREHRDHGWRLVLAEWKGPGAKEELLAGLPLEQAFPQAIARADEMADALRRQAEAVAQAEEKRFQLAETERQMDATRQKIVQLQAALQDRLASWASEWTACGLVPQSPAEMLEWRDHWIVFKDQLGKLRSAEASFERKRAQIQQARKQLAAVLGDSEVKAFSILFDRARSQVQQGERQAGRRDEIARQLARLKADLARLAQSRTRLAETAAAAAGAWRAQCQAVGLAAGTSPDAGLALLRERNELLARFDEWRELTGKLQTTAAAIEEYEQAVEKRAGTLGVAGDSTETLEAAMWKALASARKAQVTHDHLAIQIAQVQSDLAEAQTRATQSEQALQELAGLAGLAATADLEPFLAQLEQRDAFRSRISQLRNTLSGLARGQSVDDFVARVRAENPDALRERKAKAEQSRREKESALSGLRETLFQLAAQRRELEKAGDTAASFRQQAESCAATLREDAARFLRLRLATHLLQLQIERFRKENQGPLLEKSGELFAAITRGAFAGLGAEFRADDVPVLVGLRPDGSKVHVEGMSDGSRDQLYLALRLAALERHLQEHEPMPLILDDLLITFDDARATAILPQLAALATRTQIFLLTHHQHLVDLCRRTLGESNFHFHQLNPWRNGSSQVPER